MNLFDSFSSLELGLMAYAAFVNLVSFLMFGIDKGKARRNSYRISEFALMLVSAMGGAVGSCAGMVVFKHKLSKQRFSIGVPLLIVLNAIVFFAAASYIR